MISEWLVKSHDITITEYGKYPGARSIEELLNNGFIIIDKWPDATSREVTEHIRMLLGRKKAGHSGTLEV